VSPENELTLGCHGDCCVSDALDVVGERWSLLVLREIHFGVNRFQDIQATTGVPRDTLALRLRKLEEAGVIVRKRYCDRPPRDEYELTEAGFGIAPVLVALREWGERYVIPYRQSAAPIPQPR